jgi:choline dehydrogenase-like flavoprotein
VEYDYVVVGSGAGGGTVAARLAESGATVAVLEAGGDPREQSGGDPARPNDNCMPCDYDVPAFHPLAAENDAMKWDFFVQHYGEAEGRTLYPRAGTLGGCTAHNAMIFVYPHDEDWQNIADLTGDPSWRPDAMRAYFQRVERCKYRPDQWFANLFGINPSRHGFGGWLDIELPRVPIETGIEVYAPLWTEFASEFALDRNKLRAFRWLSEAGLDPNDWRLVRESSTGLRSVPMTTANHRRVGARERLLDVASRAPDRLHIELDAFATRVLFDEQNRAIGVEYRKGASYRAGRVSDAETTTLTVRARREVIVSGGAFNTPQLLMLSGIGPPEHLRALGIQVRSPLAGVGGNLQDRYEIGIVQRMRKRWPFFEGATFAPDDAQYRLWNAARSCGAYTSNGAAFSVSKMSSVAEGVPDLFCMLLLADFRGYYPGFSRDVTQNLDRMTWVVLKAHTRNRTGTVRLRSADPLDTPEIEFNYFREGGEEDLRAMVEGVRYVRSLGAPLQALGIASEVYPGADCSTDDEIADFVRKNAWGHHASCTCAIGEAAQGGVISSDFRVHGVRNLRIVDASVFPRIPGFFIASSIYMIGEKAADAILAGAGS